MRQLAVILLSTSGLILLFLAGAAGQPPVLAALLILLATTVLSARTLEAIQWSIAPLAAGNLILLMRFFPWDTREFTTRSQLLLILILLAMIILLITRLRALPRIAAAFVCMSRARQAWVVFCGAVFLYTGISILLVNRGVRPTGDEPHYMAISHSIARDFDLNIFNQHYRGLFHEFVDAERLPAHGTFGRGYKRIFSYHLPGLSVTLAPFFLGHGKAVNLNLLLRVYLGVFGALFATLIFLFARRLWDDSRTALIITALFSATTPILFYSIHLFPEIQATLLILGSLYLLLFPGNHPERNTWFAGLLLGVSVFWGVKYNLFIYLYLAGFSLYFLRQREWRRLFSFLVFPILFQALFFFYLREAYGTFSPQAVYYGMMTPEQSQQVVDTLLRTITVRMRIETLLDYFFDQRDGLLFYNPIYFFAFPGIILVLRRWRNYLPHLLISIPPLLFILNHAFSTIRAGFCPQGRYLVPSLWLFAFFVTIFFRETRFPRARTLLIAAALLAVFIAGYQSLQPATLYQPTTHDIQSRPGLMFQQWSNLMINLPGLLPSWIKTDNHNYLPNYFWLAFFLLVVCLLSFLRAVGKIMRTTIVILTGAILLAMVIFPRPGLYNPKLIMAEKGGDTSFLLFEQNPFPPGPGSGQTLLQTAGSHLFLVGLPERSAAPVFFLKNREQSPPLSVQIRHFDTPIAFARIAPGQKIDLPCPLPPGKKWRHLGLHSFSLDLSGATPKGAISLECTLAMTIKRNDG